MTIPFARTGALVLALCAASAVAAQDTPGTPDAKTFATIAASSNDLEILASQLALDTLHDGKTRAFAQQMIADHTAAAEKMTAAAKADGVDVAFSMLDQHQAMYQTLKSADPAAFEETFIAMQRDAHDEAVALFQAYAAGGQDGALRDFATATLPVLQHHEAEAQSLAGR